MQKKYIKQPSNFNKYPFIEIKNKAWTVTNGWPVICKRLNKKISGINKPGKILAIETYPGVLHEELLQNLKKYLRYDRFLQAENYMFPEEHIRQMVFPDVTDDRLFGYLTRLHIEDYYDTEKVSRLQEEINSLTEGTIIIYGTGAATIWPEPDILVYADMTRWEIQLRMRRHLVDNLGMHNRDVSDWMLLYKQGYFVDWRVCDRLKKELFDNWDFLLDTNKINEPKLVEGKAILEGLKMASERPFSVVPYFDQGPWGGQWLKEVCKLDPVSQNYAWCFNCVPEENSLLFKFGKDIIEIPSINLVFCHPRELLGDPVHARFGDEFPIRFDFLDTMDGGNLSLQVHPLTEYIQEKFGMHYTQDESYYIMDSKENAFVYLGLREGINRQAMFADLEDANAGGHPFEAEKYVQTWPVKKHDHLLIPAGTIHCSGKNNMVLEISATPYIFTFKLWDWGRLGLDGKPRPINLEHGKNVIQWDRTTSWIKENLVNKIRTIAGGDGWIEERTGLHKREFIETRRLWFTKKVEQFSRESVQVLCLIEGDEVIVESPDQQFEALTFHYAEVFIIPASVKKYSIRPSENTKGKLHAVIKASVRY